MNWVLVRPVKFVVPLPHSSLPPLSPQHARASSLAMDDANAAAPAGPLVSCIVAAAKGAASRVISEATGLLGPFLHAYCVFRLSFLFPRAHDLPLSLDKGNFRGLHQR